MNTYIKSLMIGCGLLSCIAMQAKQERSLENAAGLFVIGYATGVVPILGQGLFAFLFSMGMGGSDNILLDGLPPLAGHALGMATVYFACKGLVASLST